MKKKYLIVTGGAGFIGSNLIERLLKETKYKIISLDSYSSGFKKNHIQNNRVVYINGNTKNFKKIFSKIKSKIKAIFHFGEFSRIAQSFESYDQLYESNVTGTFEVISFCKQNKIKIIYSATSASFGNNFSDQNLSPYAFTKTQNLKLILNFSSWYDLKYEIIYFFNVYGPRQIINHKMSAVIGIFEECKRKNIALPVVRPGTQKRNFTHVEDTVNACIIAFKKNKNRQYTTSHKNAYNILEVAKLFKQKYKFLPPRKGERFKSTLINRVLDKKIYHLKAKKDLKKYVQDFLKTL